MLNTINQFCQNYYDQIPTGSLKAVGLSAVTTFTATVIFLSAKEEPNKAMDLSRPFLCASIAVLAATIHALLTPIFNYIFDNNGGYNPYQEISQILISMTLTQLLINRITFYNINLLTTRVIPHRNNVVILTSSVLRMATDLALRIINNSFPFPPHVLTQITTTIQSSCQRLGVNFNQTTPIYLAV